MTRMRAHFTLLLWGCRTPFMLALPILQWWPWGSGLYKAVVSHPSAGFPSESGAACPRISAPIAAGLLQINPFLSSHPFTGALCPFGKAKVLCHLEASRHPSTTPNRFSSLLKEFSAIVPAFIHPPLDRARRVLDVPFPVPPFPLCLVVRRPRPSRRFSHQDPTKLPPFLLPSVGCSLNCAPRPTMLYWFLDTNDWNLPKVSFICHAPL